MVCPGSASAIKNLAYAPWGAKYDLDHLLNPAFTSGCDHRHPLETKARRLASLCIWLRVSSPKGPRARLGWAVHYVVKCCLAWQLVARFCFSFAAFDNVGDKSM